MRVGLNRPHLALWGRLALLWLMYVGFCLVAGWHLKPRPDEVAFVLLLPLPFVVLYALGCLVLAGIKAWSWPVRHKSWKRVRLGRGVGHAGILQGRSEPEH